MSTVVQEGPLQMWNEQKKRWQQVHCKLQQSGWFYWYDKPSAKKPIHGVDLKEVAAFFAFGPMLQQLPTKSAGVNEQNVNRAFAVPHEPHRQTVITFFQCDNEADMNSWISSIFSSLQSEPAQNYQPSAPLANSYPLNNVPQATVPPTVQSPGGNLQMTSQPGPSIRAPYPIQPGPAPQPIPYYPQQYGTYHLPHPQPLPQMPYAMPPPPVYSPHPSTPPPIMNPDPAQGYFPQPVYIAPPNAVPGPQRMIPRYQMQQYQPTGVQTIPMVTSGNSAGSAWKTAAIGAASGLAGNFLANSLFGGGWGGGWGGRWGGGWSGGGGGGNSGCAAAGGAGGGCGGGQIGPTIFEETNIYNMEDNDINYVNNVDLGNDSGLDFMDEVDFNDFEL